MLDVHLFMNPRFSAASVVGVTSAFFALFGFIFLVTQYFQFLRGYSALSAGVHTLPFAVAAGVMAPLGARVALRFGTKVAVVGGLAAMSVGLWWAATLDASTAYWGPVAASMILIGGGLTLTTAPATAAILGALPPEKAGVGSAVNDTTRELGGTLGVAIVGLLLSVALRTAPRAPPAHGAPSPGGRHRHGQGIARYHEDRGRPRPPIPCGPSSFARPTTGSSTASPRDAVAAAAAALGVVVALIALPARERAGDENEVDLVAGGVSR